MDIAYRAGILKKTILLAALCALFISMDVSARAQGTINLEAQAGLDGACKTGVWLPVRVTVENTGGDLDARVQASYKNDNGGQSVYAMDISLPATSRKEFFLYVYPTGSLRDFRVSVLDGNTTRGKKDLNVSCTGDTLLFGILADDPSPYNILNDIRPLSGGRTRLAQLTIPDLPDRAQGWSALDALVISNVDTGRLTAEQKQAMQLWLANGGKLFITGGIHWQTTTAGLRDFLPVNITSTKNVMGLPALSAYIKDSSLLGHEAILASGRIQDGSHVLVSQAGIPLLVEKQVGYGKVYYFAADPGMRPLNEWDGIKEVYNHLLAFKPQKPSWANASWNSNQANNALSALPELNLPSFFYICCWLGVYILAIGPANYLILRRIKRTELAWVTVPVLVILFSCLAYVSGLAYRGVSPILNRLALAQSWDSVSRARVNDLVGVYSPSRTTYNIQTQDQFMLYQPSGMDTGLQGNDDWLLLKSEAGTTLPDVRVEIGGMRSIGVEGSMPALEIQHDLVLTLTENTPDLTGTITNTGSHTLRDAVLVTPSDWHVLGDLAPNKAKKINFPVHRPAAPKDMYAFLSDLGMPYYSSSYSSPNNIDLTRRAAFLQANVVFTNNTATMVSGIYLMGWLDDIPAPVNLQDRDSDVIDTMLYFHKLTFGVAERSQPFLINSSLYDWESSTGTMSTYQIPTDGYEIRFQPSQVVKFSVVESFTLEVMSTAVDKAQIELWNFETQKWDFIPLNLNTAHITDAAPYIGAGGEVRMQINANQNDYVDIQAVIFTMKVKP